MKEHKDISDLYSDLAWDEVTPSPELKKRIDDSLFKRRKRKYVILFFALVFGVGMSLFIGLGNFSDTAKSVYVSDQAENNTSKPKTEKKLQVSSENIQDISQDSYLISNDDQKTILTESNSNTATNKLIKKETQQPLAFSKTVIPSSINKNVSEDTNIEDHSISNSNPMKKTTSGLNTSSASEIDSGYESTNISVASHDQPTTNNHTQKEVHQNSKINLETEVDLKLDTIPALLLDTTAAIDSTSENLADRTFDTTSIDTNFVAPKNNIDRSQLFIESAFQYGINNTKNISGFGANLHLGWRLNSFEIKTGAELENHRHLIQNTSYYTQDSTYTNSTFFSDTIWTTDTIFDTAGNIQNFVNVIDSINTYQLDTIHNVQVQKQTQHQRTVLSYAISIPLQIAYVKKWNQLELQVNAGVLFTWMQWRNYQSDWITAKKIHQFQVRGRLGARVSYYMDPKWQLYLQGQYTHSFNQLYLENINIQAVKWHQLGIQMGVRFYIH